MLYPNALFLFVIAEILNCEFVFYLAKEEMKSNRIRRRVYELLSKAASSETSGPSPVQRELHFVFYRKPDKFVESNEKSGHVAGVQLEKTVLRGIFFPQTMCSNM